MKTLVMCRKTKARLMKGRGREKRGRQEWLGKGGLQGEGEGGDERDNEEERGRENY